MPPGAVRPRKGLATAAAACALAGLAACSSVPTLPPVPPHAGSRRWPGQHSRAGTRFQVGDVLGVRLLLNPELNEEVTVRPDGRISTTVVKDELASGRTVPELTAALTRDYSSGVAQPAPDRLGQILRTHPDLCRRGGRQSRRVRHRRSQPHAVAGDRARRGLKPMTGDEDSVYIIRRGPNDVPQFLSVRFQDVMWAHDPTRRCAARSVRRGVRAAHRHRGGLPVRQLSTSCNSSRSAGASPTSSTPRAGAYER